ncbi:MAG: hypothetical protein AB8A46_07895 [Prochlorococcus sp.]
MTGFSIPRRTVGSNTWKGATPNERGPSTPALIGLVDPLCGGLLILCPEDEQLADCLLR